MATQPQLTINEVATLKAAFASAARNGHDFGFTEDIVKQLKGSAKAAGARITSLIKKGIIEVHDPVTTNEGHATEATYTQFTWCMPLESIKALVADKATKDGKPARPATPHSRIWIELDKATDALNAAHQCTLANKMLAKLGIDIKRDKFFVSERHGNFRYCYGGNYGYTELVDRGQWFSLDFFAK